MNNSNRELDKPLPVWRKPMGVMFDILFYIAILAMIAGSTMSAFSNNASKSISSYRFYTVLSDSMRPTFSKGDMIIVKLTDDVKEGDIITFNP